MSSPGALVVITCNESDSRIDPSRYFNLSAAKTKVFKTAGGRTSNAINDIYYADQANRIGMIIVVQHTSPSHLHMHPAPCKYLTQIDCPSSPGTTETNVRNDIRALKDSPHVRNDIPVVGYVLNTETGQLREVNVPRSAPDAEARRRVLSQMGDFGPFWS
ncbi:hypothetical protein DE146DRAFT_764216 [Phaeosphaeria sp. MPI-PUGE-AT-0046c]|nr:hypothetical protein DE146DRAFT_764216 [Phaeosphaeria sp. MPI-PUGE-AT-0046c]